MDSLLAELKSLPASNPIGAGKNKRKVDGP
jgi:hypothetical protein